MFVNQKNKSATDYLSALVNLKTFLEENPLISGVVQNLTNTGSSEIINTANKSSAKAIFIGACLLKIQ
jgi:hypothetical protein